jgi:ribosomal protein S18 acetylase RimI-like enzyme
MHPLDNPIWTALATLQENFAVSYSWARMFPPQVTPLGSFLGGSDEGYGALSRLLARGSAVALFLDRSPQLRPGWKVLMETDLMQMVHEGPVPSRPGNSWLRLSAIDVPEMVALAELTKPGPFAARTYEMGTYIGIKHNGKLVAMAGERLHLPGLTEVSAVCTHPDHTGHGYAASLIIELMNQIRERGEKPFLHVRADNARAIELYRRLGFYSRTVFRLAVVRWDGDESATPSS